MVEQSFHKRWVESSILSPATLIMNEITPKTIGFGIIAIVVLMLALFGVWKLTSKKAAPPVKVDIKVTDTDHKIGSDSAKLTLVEYSDFQCPACGAYYPILKPVIEKNKDRLFFVYRHFPLDQHKNARVAAYSAEAAAKQGKFWPMHDLLFENQSSWSEKDKPMEVFSQYAKDLKLDIEQFKKDVNSQEIKSRVESDQQSGTSFGVNSTPSFFLNGTKLDNPRSADEFQKLIDEANK